ncbi:MAG: TadE/TadG family type IV pilus assembly protein [Actinomycetota bacterium]
MQHERGAQLVEFALVSVLLFVIIFGLIEGGLLVRARNNVASSADDAARRGAIAADESSADWQILRQLEVRGALRASQINYVVVYRASSSTEAPPATCQAGTPVTDVCNVYERADFDVDASLFTCSDPGLDANWCPTDRAEDTTAFEYVGVWINATHTGLFGIFGDVELGAQSVLPLEGSGGV